MTRLGLRVSAVLAGVLLCASAAHAGDPPIRLKSRTFVPVANVGQAVQPRRFGALRAGGNRHYLIQFTTPPNASTLDALRAAGAIPLAVVPDNAIAIAAPAGFSAATIAGARWVGTMQPADRLSSQSQADVTATRPVHPFTVIEFFADVTPQAIDDLLLRAGTTAIQVTGVPANVRVIATVAPVIDALSAHDEVAWIYPAGDEIVSGQPTAYCAGLAGLGGTPVADFAIVGDGWDGPGLGSASIGYYFSAASADLPAATQARELGRAMEEWSRYAAITWRQAASAVDPRTVDILWGPTYHGDGFPFAFNQLAHTFFPAPPSLEPLAGDLHFNDEFLWGANQPGRIDVFSVALHELGHALGLNHSSDPNAIMYPMYRGVVSGLAPDDIDGIRALYAARGSSTPAGWRYGDVGTPATMGTIAGTGDAFTISASGADVWGSTDAFTFASRTLTGDGDIVARVDSLQQAHRWSKAGVMIRDGRDPSAAHAFMLVSGGKGLAFQRRRIAGGASISTDGIAGAAPAWVRLARRGDLFEAYASADGRTWRLIGSDSIAMADTVEAGVAVTAHADGATATARFSSVAVTPSVRWQSQDVGRVALAGSLAVSVEKIDVTGNGADIWNSADAFRFAWQPLSGDGEIVARVASVGYASPWSKAGVMIRASLDPSSPHAFMLVSPGKGYAFQRREAWGGESASSSGGPGSAPAWVRLVREGDEVSGYVSRDGATWQMVGRERIAMDRDVLVGLAVTSHAVTARCHAVFESVRIQ